jgi:hypothetical protein
MADSNVQAVLFGPEPGDADAIFINDRSSCASRATSESW